MQKWFSVFVTLNLFMVIQVYSQGVIAIQLDLVAEGLSSPVAGSHAGDGSGRLFIAEQTGLIKIFQDGQILSEPFLDLRRTIISPGSANDERGLLGIAMHPNYAENGRFFVYYSATGGGAGSNHRSVVAEYHVSADDPNTADTEGREILTFDQPQSNHNAGQLAFGADGMLYIGSGDGGGANDQHGSIGNGQNLNILLGKILRINVDGTEPYEIPTDNPFTDIDGEDEIWAYGLRNPWRFSFDRGGSNELFCADVGQNQWEEVNIITRGGNYGWRIMEASDCFNPSRNCDQEGITLPIAEYSHSEGISITGGFVYRGQRYSSLFGKYIFSDWIGAMFYISRNDDGTWDRFSFDVNGTGGNSADHFITSFVEGEDGELYVLGNESTSSSRRPGTIHLLTVPGDVPVSIEDWERL
jgi:glucose/arabinose dehydrogenase